HRHARAWPGHPRLYGAATSKTWMAGTSPAMTSQTAYRTLSCPAMTKEGFVPNDDGCYLNLLSTVPGMGCDLSRPFASRITQTLFSEHSAQVSPLRPNRCSTLKLERPNAIVLSTVTSSPNRVGLRKRACVRTSGKPPKSKFLNI